MTEAKKSADPKTEAPKSELEKVAEMLSEPVAEKPAPLVEGKKARLRAVFGYIQNPFTLKDFDTDRSSVVTVDSWTFIQHEAGKLVVSEE